MTVSHWNIFLLSSPFTIVLKYKLPQTSLVKNINNVCVHIRVQCGTYPRTTLNTTEKCCAKQVWWKPPKSCFSKQENKMGGCVECIMWAMSSKNRTAARIQPICWTCGMHILPLKFYTTSFWWRVDIFSESDLVSIMWGKRAVHSCHSESVSMCTFLLKGIVHP